MPALRALEKYLSSISGFELKTPGSQVRTAINNVKSDVQELNSKLETLLLRFADRPNDFVILRSKEPQRPHVAVANDSLGIDHEN
jgi:hypothetical protein